MKARWWIGGAVVLALMLVVVVGAFLTTGADAPARRVSSTATAPAANGPAPAPPEDIEQEQAEGRAKAYALDQDDDGEAELPAEAPPEDQKAAARRPLAKKESGKLVVDSAPPGGQVLALLGSDETSLDGVFEGADPFSQRGIRDVPQMAPEPDPTVEDDEEDAPRSQVVGGLAERGDGNADGDRIERSKSELENERKPAPPAKPKAKAPPPPLQVGRLRLPAVVPYDPDAGEPATTLPNMAYFENTYLGGNAAHVELLRRAGRAWRRIGLPPQPFDGPEDAGLALSVAVDRTHVDRPSRVMLQVGLEGSGRAGWRRPPLDVVVVLDASAVRTPRVAVRLIGALIERLGPADRVAVRRVGDAAPIVPLTGPATARRALMDDPQALLDDARRGTLATGLVAAGRDLEAAADTARIPGTGVVLTVLGPRAGAPTASVQRAAHALTTAGVTVSVLETAGGAVGAVTRSDWWRVAHAGHGGHHRVTDGDALVAAVDAELDRLSRVVARLVRVNIRLAPGVKAVRVLGSRLLDADEVQRVKAREKAVDDRLSRTMGVSADRGDDDDGLQTVIPYFLGDDTHVILVELWVERAGPIADVSLRYKDMVRLDNGRAAGHVSLGSLPRPAGPIEIGVLRNARGVAFAEALGNAARVADEGLPAQRWLDYAQALASDAADAALADRLARYTRRHAGARAARALEIAARRRLGVGHALAGR